MDAHQGFHTMTTSALIMSILQQLGCQPEVNEENHISFKYQGDDFLVQRIDSSH